MALSCVALVSLMEVACSTSGGRSGPPAAATRDAQPDHATGPVEVALTVDDLPIHGPIPAGTGRLSLADRMTGAFRRHGMPPVHGFVNGARVGEASDGEALLAAWLATGNRLGNHTYSHVSLNAVGLPEYLADIERGEDILRKLEPDARLWKVFRYPFLFEGDTAAKRDGARRYLRERGYRTAEVTIEADDWAFNQPFVRCTGRGDREELARLRRLFVDVHVDELARMRELTRRLVGRDIPHVLLLHLGAADADAIEELLLAYERAGVRWISLDQALADPFFALDPGVPFPFGAAFPYLLARARGVAAPPPIFARGLEGRLKPLCR